MPRSDRASKSVDFEAAIFDFNGTVSGSRFIAVYERYEQFLKVPARQFVADYSASGLLEMVQTGRISEKEFWLRVSKATGTSLDILHKIADEIRDSWEIDYEVLSIVDELRSKFKVALLTDNVQETFEYWVRKFKLHSHFHVIVNSSDVGFMKNNPEIYKLTLTKLGCKPENALFIDDYEGNVAMAKGIGMKGILFRNAALLHKSLDAMGILPHGGGKK